MTTIASFFRFSIEPRPIETERIECEEAIKVPILRGLCWQFELTIALVII